ncbi:MAG: septum formation initiator family protein, partial [Anaerolineaceae bacterium]
MKKWLQKLHINEKHLLVAGALVVLVVLLMSFNERISGLLRLETDRDQVNTSVGQLKQTQQNLQTQIAYATSEIAVEEWARQDRKMVQEGDVAVIPLVAPGTTPPAPTAVAPVTTTVSKWDVWWA